MFHTNTHPVKVNPNTTRGICYAMSQNVNNHIEPKGRAYRLYSLQCQREGGQGYYYERLSIQVNVTAHHYYVAVMYRPAACMATVTRGMGVANRRCFAEADFVSIVLLGLRQVFPDIDYMHDKLPDGATVHDIIQRLADVGAFEGYYNAILSTTIEN